MKTTLLLKSQTLLILMLLLQPGRSFAQINWNWAATGGKGVNSYSYSAGNDVAFDQNNNTYVAGCVSSPAKVGNLVLNSYGFSDILIAKYDTLGNPVWAKTAGGPNNDIAKSITIGSDGYIYVCGFFIGAAHFDNLIINDPSQCYFVAKLDTNGNYIWVKHGSNDAITNSVYEPSFSIITDANHVYLAGNCKNNGQLIDTVYTNNPPYTAVFISQLDTSGNMNWTHFIKSSSLSMAGNIGIDMAVDQSGNLIYTGSIARVDTVINGPSSITIYGNLILGKLSSAGNVIWEREFGDTSSYIWGGIPRAISLDANDQIYVGGIYHKHFLLNPSPGPNTNGGFFAKFNPANGNIIDAQSFTASNGSVPSVYGCNYHYDGNILYSGNLCGVVDFGGITIQPISSSYDCDDFVASYDTLGNLDWVVRYGNYNYDFIRGSASNNQMYAVTGSFKDSLSIGSHTLIADNFTSNSDFFFIATEIKKQTLGLITVPNSDLYFNIYPNPASSTIVFETKNNFSDYTVELFSSDSKYSKRYQNLSSNAIDISDLTPGTYFISLNDGKVSVVKRFVKVN